MANSEVHHADGQTVSNLEELIIMPQLVEDVPFEDLNPEVRQRWFVQVDLEELIATKNIKVLARSEALQLKLAAEYRIHKSKRDKETMDPQAILQWNNLLFVTGELYKRTMPHQGIDLVLSDNKTA